MLVGFDLFDTLGREFEGLEAYPQAIVRRLGVGSAYESSTEGHSAQLKAVADALGLPVRDLQASMQIHTAWVRWRHLAISPPPMRKGPCGPFLKSNRVIAARR